MTPENENRQLQAEIRALKREIGELSALLALKKMENDHPSLLKFADEIHRAGQAFAHGRDWVSEKAQRYLPELEDNEPLRIAGRVILMGSLAYVISWLLGRLWPRS